jgi:putative ABC transport system permease protein
MESLFKDIQYGVRNLVHRPGFTLIAVVTLALGIGATTAIFSVVNAVILRPLPYQDPGQLVRLWSDSSGKRTDQNQFSPAEITDFRDQVTSFEEIGLFDYGLSANLTGGTQPERVNGSEASPALFSVLRVTPVLGRTFLPEETDVKQSKVVLISEALWKRRFGADPNLTSSTIQLDGEAYTVVGVLPDSFKFPEKVDLWLPFSFTAADWKNDRQHQYVEAVGRLKPGITLIQAKAELEMIMQRLALNFSATRKSWGITLVPLQEQVVGKISSTLWILFGAVGFVLLIACVNVANLMLARSTSRRKEMSIRVALGAGRGRVVKQLLTESLLLGCVGAGVGVLLAFWAVKLFSISGLDSLPRAEEVTVDRRVLLFTLITAIVTSVAFGLAPALQAANSRPNEMLKEGGRRSAGSRSRLRNALVISEISLSLVLLIGAGLLVRSFWQLSSVNPGFDPHHVLTMQVTLPKTQYADTARQNAFVQEALQRLGSLPGVKTVGATINLPLIGTWGMGYRVVGHDNNQQHVADNSTITPQYFLTMGIPILKGRDFSERDTTDGPPVIIISEALARKHFFTENPVGQIIDVGAKREIVGVVADVKPRGLELESKPQIYLPYAQKPTNATFLTFTIRTEGEPLSLARAAASEIGKLDKDLPVADIRTMEEIVSTSLQQRRLMMLLFGGFALIAVALAAIGIYGVIAYSVAQRTHELGIRMALGAQLNDVLKLVLKEGMLLALIGVAIGVGGAFALTRLITGLLFGVTPTDTMTFAVVAGGLLVVALLACYVPARRATKVDPLDALRYE